MKSKLASVGIVVLLAASIFVVSINTHQTNAVLICVDKYNSTSIIPCSDQNAIVKPTAGALSTRAGGCLSGDLACLNNIGSNATSANTTSPNDVTYANCLARYGQDIYTQHPPADAVCGKEAYPWLYTNSGVYIIPAIPPTNLFN